MGMSVTGLFANHWAGLAGVSGTPLVSGVPWIQRLAVLEAGVPESNSLHEYVTGQIQELVFQNGNASLQSSLFGLLAAPYSVNDVFRFTRETGLSRHFDLSPGRTAVDRFLRTIQEKKSGAASPFGADAVSYDLGPDFVRNVFDDALEDALLAGEVSKALERSQAESLPFLGLHRLFHVLLSPDHDYKVGELLRFPRDLKTAPAVPPEEILGTIHTGFLEDLELDLLIRSVVEEARTIDFNARWEQWCRDSEQVFLKSPALSPELIAGLLDILPTEPARAFASRIRTQEIRVLFQEPEKMRSSRPGNHPSGEHKIMADYSLPGEDGPSAAVVLAVAGDRFGRVGQLRDPRFRLVLAARALHDVLHIGQALDRGENWPNRKVLLAEMLAYAGETLQRLQWGDVSLYREIQGYSPLGFGLALRNFVEHLYIRQGAPLPFPPGS